MKITIYTTPNCHYCQKAKEFFDKNKVEYETIDVQKDKEKRKEMIEASGQMGVPVIMIDDRIFVGFGEEALAEALGIKQ